MKTFKKEFDILLSRNLNKKTKSNKLLLNFFFSILK